MFAMLVLSTALAVSPPEVSLRTCAFEPSGSRWTGSCGRLFHQQPRMTLARAAAITTGVWRDDVTPMEVWSGEMTGEGSHDAPLELEIDAGGTGVFRTEYGWFPVSGYAASATMLSFRLDASHEVPPDQLDRRIVQLADATLSSPAVWNRADNRRCPASASAWSIYCAVERVEIQVTGGFHHRRPAMELVRRVIEERTAGRHYHHRLMDYNNDPSTALADVHSVFAEALARMDRASR
ncbi:MAG TPA: hypothetical protein VHS78_09700 [Candidatus Elarobacter sp.]|jgi:hypothetical protein|nr:hypothetical protein [Candidatus Elarobacter sp.]